ncbi:MAG TPA: DNA translocase FtsK 4TM domain-containing protein [bacterium]|nr:DNA translocase FtsK 4TM domain-containing protein [bacterium]
MNDTLASRKRKNKPKKDANGFRIVSTLHRIAGSILRLTRHRVFRESVGLFLIACSVFLVIGLSTFRSENPGKPIASAAEAVSRCGDIGTAFTYYAFEGLGIIAWCLPVIIAFHGIVLFRQRRLEYGIVRSIGVLLFLASASALVSLLLHQPITYHDYHLKPGGRIGHHLTESIFDPMGVWGSGILLTTMLLVSILIITDISYNLLLSKIHHMSAQTLRRLFSWLRRIVVGSIQHLRSIYQYRSEIRKAKRSQREERKAIQAEDERAVIVRHDTYEVEDVDHSEEIGIMDEDPEESFGETSPGLEIEAPPLVYDSEDLPEPEYVPDLMEPDRAPRTAIDPQERLEFVKTRAMEFELPGIDLFDRPAATAERESKDILLKKSEILINKLSEFNIEGRVTEVCPGPVITRYEFEPAPGIKISKIIGLSDDLALGMKSRYGLRISPMPGKSTLGIEVPNQHRETVYLRDILLSDEFRAAQQKSILTLPLGKDTAGRPFISDLKRMPHLLIAGATGSGKSVCINTILAGLLFIAKPTQLRLLLIDPKMLELSDFNGIPHLREPVITDTKMAPDALNWAVAEMERRYRLLADNGVRNIDQFNDKISASADPGDLEPLPYLVIVIDELADLMITAASAVEETIQRLAQMARAAGIHLIIATQRPSVDVITGVIKANLPCRLAFQVASRVDSRTIIDSTGAEKLLGMGDFIFIPPGTSQLVRAHGAFVGESEVKRLVHYLSDQPGIDDEDSIFQNVESSEGPLDEIEDPMYCDAVKLVLSSGLASISMLQRRLKVGHSRASRLIDYMELNGIVGPHIGSKPREILVDRDEFLARLQEIGETGIYDDSFPS